MTFDDQGPTGLELMRVPGEFPSDRIWLVSSGEPSAVEGYSPCGPVVDVGGTYHVECLAPTG